MAYYVKTGATYMSRSDYPADVRKFDDLTKARAYAIKLIESGNRDTTAGVYTIRNAKYIYTTKDCKKPQSMVWFDWDFKGTYMWTSYDKGRDYCIFKNGTLMNRKEKNDAYIRWQKAHPFESNPWKSR